MEARSCVASAYGPARPECVPVYVKKIGSREEVWQGLAERTKGGLRREDLKEKVTKRDPQSGREYTKIVSRRASEASQRLGYLEGYLRRRNYPADTNGDGAAGPADPLLAD